MFLVDTDVISGSAPTKSSGRDETIAWLRAHGDRVYLSTITVAELKRGIAFLAGKGHHRKAAALESWEKGLVERFSNRILALDHAVARRAGELFGAAEARGHDPGLADACIAATADLNRLVVVTSNVRHFRALGVAHQRLGDEGDHRP